MVLGFLTGFLIFEKLEDGKTVVLEVSSTFYSGNAFEEKSSVLKEKPLLLRKRSNLPNIG